MIGNLSFTHVVFESLNYTNDHVYDNCTRNFYKFLADKGLQDSYISGAVIGDRDLLM